MNKSKEVVPPMFRLDGKNRELINDGERIIIWELLGNERELARVAGIDRFDFRESGEGYGELHIPEGTRNASSVLSGVEAWEGEKKSIVSAVSAYIKYLRRFNHFDRHLSWSTVGRTPQNQIFIVPPYELSTLNTESEIEEANMLNSQLVNNLDVFLSQTGPDRSDLAKEFALNIGVNYGNDR